jgi:hypothetical protein
MKTSDMNTDQFGDFFLRLIRNREDVIKDILLDIDRTEKQVSGLSSVIPSMTSETSSANVRHQLKTCMQVQAQQAQIIRKLLMLTLISVSSDDFVSHVAKMATKFGKGDEAFREFVKHKFPGLNK